jgi:two-component sensor histidine kinase
MVAALSVYCDLLEEPGVLSRAFAHYGSELRLVTAASRRLVEKLMALDGSAIESSGSTAVLDSEPGLWLRDPQPKRWPDLTPATALRQPKPRLDPAMTLPIANLAEELLANRNLLAALAGPAIAVTIETEGGARPVRITGEDLTRVLVNLVKNATEAMPGSGHIRIVLSERATKQGNSTTLVVAVEDNGPGIPERMLEKIFERGYSTHTFTSAPEGGWPAAHRGLGLTICRAIAEVAGGRLMAIKCATGARLEMELPVQGGGAPTEPHDRTGFVIS